MLKNICKLNDSILVLENYNVELFLFSLTRAKWIWKRSYVSTQYFFLSILYNCWKFLLKLIVLFFLNDISISLCCGIITTWTHACLLRPSCYSLAALLMKKTYSLVSISLSIKSNVFGLTSKIFYCLAKWLISEKLFITPTS